jgi:putative DNA primase/helicase
MSAAERIAARLGYACREGRGWRCTCPVHGGHSLVVADGREGRLLLKCWGGNCSVKEIFGALRRLRLIGHGEAALGSQVCPSDCDCDSRRIAAARRLWSAARDACRSPVVRYFASRGITILPPACLRWLPACPHPTGVIQLPAMLAAIVNVDGELIGVHRTYLRSDGAGKADIDPAKAMLGRAAGGAVRLAAVRTDDWTVVGEGIETVASVMQCTGLPGWAALSTSGIDRLLLPPGARMVLIVADHDANGTGERAARRAARRWLAEGRRVRIAVPPEVGADANDLLIGPRSVAA